MTRICYVNGEFVPEDEARVSVFDRGFLFADGVYEVSTVLGGRLIDNEAHLRRLARSLGELDMHAPVPLEDIPSLQRELVVRNHLHEGVVYLQVTRGAADRDFKFPADAEPTLVMFTQELTIIESPKARDGISVITVPDIRWKRRDIKTVGLLGSVLAKEAARSRGADDAWLTEDGLVTEGASNNAYIVGHDGVVVTRHLSSEILSGITRKAVLRLCDEEHLTVEERAFSLDEALAASEAFVTSASTLVWPVVKIDDVRIGDGRPGRIAPRLRAIYLEQAMAAD